MFIYCSTKDSPKIVGNTICKASFIKGEKQLWKVNDEGEFFSINMNSKAHCVAVVYSVNNSVVGIEIDDDCASKVIEPLMDNYGFQNVKWL